MTTAPTPPAARIGHGWLLGGSMVGLGLLFLLSVAWGPVRIPLRAVVQVLTGGEVATPAWETIVWTFRLPKAITAALAGAGLAVSGLQMQTLFRNPLAGPFVLGINAGASLGVALVVLTAASTGLAWLGASGAPGAWTLVIAATLGAVAVLGMIAAVAVRVADSTTLLIIGLMFSSATGALVSILQYFSSAERIQSFLIWSFGSFASVTWTQMTAFAPTVAVGLVGALLLVKPMNALLLGERYAESLGARVTPVRIGIILCTSVLAGSITAFCGPIAFLGLAVPHLARGLTGSSDHRLLMPLVILLGANLALLCDLLAGLPGMQQTLPINAVTSLFGAPVVIWVILQSRNLGRSFAA